MALVRGVICLSLSDWAPAVAPSLASARSALSSARLAARSSPQPDGWRWGEGWREDKDEEENGRFFPLLTCGPGAPSRGRRGRAGLNWSGKGVLAVESEES